MFKVNWDIVITWLIPPIIRKSRFIEYMKVAYSSMVMIYQEFLNLRETVLSEITWQGNTADFEWLLYQLYGADIWIETKKVSEPVYIYTDGEIRNRHVYVFDDADLAGDPTLENTYIFSDGILNGVYNFVVHIPIAMQSRNNEIINTVKRYKPSGMTFTIING